MMCLLMYLKYMQIRVLNYKELVLNWQFYLKSVLNRLNSEFLSYRFVVYKADKATTC